jgi:hypothetical protein
MWNCPSCSRTFKNPNQAHSCVRINAADLLSGSTDTIKAIYEKVTRIVGKFGEVQENSSKSTINFKNGATFMVLKPKKERMELEFVLEDERKEFPVYKTFRISKNRVAHYVALEKPDEVDKQITGWLKQAYDTVSKSGK